MSGGGIDQSSLPEWATAPHEPRRHHSAWPWIVSALIVAVLAVAAWFIAEWIAREIVERTIRDQVVTSLALPPEQEVAVTVEGAVIPQLLSGTLDDVTVAAEDVPVGALVGDVTVHAEGIAIRGDAAADAATATVRLDSEQLNTLLAGVEGFPAESVTLDEPDVVMTTELSLFGVAIPVGVSLTPSAAEGDIVLTPSQLQVAGADVSADDLRSRFGPVADVVLRDWTVCIAQYIPAGLTLTGVAVDGDEIVADLDIDGGILSDPALQADGTCA